MISSGSLRIEVDAKIFDSYPNISRPALSGQSCQRPILPLTDSVEISEEAKEVQAKEGEYQSTENKEELTPAEQRQVREMSRRDQEVRRHEMAHIAAGAGVITSGPNFEYEVGPDGKRYVVDGHVNIDVSPESEPQATINKMQRVRKAALAPAQPSGADRAVAAKAAQIEAKARLELVKEKQRDSGGSGIISDTGLVNQEFSPETIPASGGVDITI